MDHYWQVFPGVKNVLFTGSARKGYGKLRIPPAEIKSTVFSHPEFVSYTREVEAVFAAWQKKHIPGLKGMESGINPKTVIHGLAEDILRTFGGVALIDAYDVYQHLMTYWVETMQDDVYLVALDGWKANSELIPAPLVIARYFASEQKALLQLEADKEVITRQKEEMEEEQGGEEGLLAEVISEQGKISKGSVQKRIKEIEKEVEAADELRVLREYSLLMEKEVEAGSKKAEQETNAAFCFPYVCN